MNEIKEKIDWEVRIMKYCAEIESNTGLAQKYHKNIKKIEEWYLKMYDKYQTIFKTEMVYQLFQKEQIAGGNDEIVFDMLNNYEDGFDTKVSVFAMTEILCRHLLSVFSFGPENDGVLAFSQDDITFQNGVHKSWFNYQGGLIDLTEIVQYFFEKENVVIPGVDLSILLDERYVRNRLIHKGEFEACLSGIRRFNILRNILIFMDEEARARLPEFVYPDDCICDMQGFFDLTNAMDFKDTTTILVTGSMLDLNQSYVSDFLGLPWNIVLDFSGGLQNQGMRALIPSNRIHQQTISMRTAQNIIKNLSLSQNYTEWLICGDYLTPCLPEGNSLENLVTGKDAFYIGDRRTYSNYIDGIMKGICNIAKNRLKSVTIVFMYADDTVANKLLKYCEELLYKSVSYSFAGIYYWDAKTQNDLFTRVFGDYVYDIEDVSDRFHVYPCDLVSFLKGLQKYGIGEQLEQMNEISDIKEIPSSTSYVEISQNLSYDLERFFDVLYKNCGKYTVNREELLQKFYRGGVAPWSAFYDGNVIDLVPDEDKHGNKIHKIKSVLGRLPDRKTDKIFYIEHAPGIGGSTLLRSIGWELSKEYPVLLIHNYDKVYTKKVLEQLYDTVKRAFVVLADETFSELEDLEVDIKNLQRPCALVVSIRDTNVTSSGHTRLPLKKISALAEKQLRSLFKANSPLNMEEKNLKDSKYDEFIHQDSYMRSPFMIGLYYMDREFYGVESYVSRAVDAVSNNKELSVLGFIALADIYGQVDLPKILINKYLGLSINANYVATHNYVQSILLYNSKTASYKSKHPLISKKMLNLCSLKLYQVDFSEKMREWAFAYIDFIIDECRNGFQDVYQTLLEKVFIRNRVAAVDGISQSDFSQYIEKVQLPEHRVDILEYLAQKCKEYTVLITPEENPQIYLMTSHFYGHLARLYGKKDSGIRNYEKALNSSRISMEYMEIGGEKDSRIYHMHAKTRSDKLIYEWETYYPEEYIISNEMYDNYEDEIRDICRIYDQSAEYGGGDYAYPSEMDLLIKYIRFVYRKKGIDNKQNLDKLTETQQEFRTNIGIINDQLDGYEFDDNMVSAIDGLIRIYRTEIMLGDYGSTIQYYENKLNNALRNHEMPSVVERYRAGFINAKIEKCKIREGKRWIFNPNTSQKDVCDILDNLELALAQGYDDQNFRSRQRRATLYNNWMTVAKYSSRAISNGIAYALEWKALEEKDKQIDPRPYYYLYVLYYLSVLEGNIDNKKYLQEYQILSAKKATQAGKSLNYIRDLLIEGKGMGQLLEIHYIESGMADKIGDSNKLREMEGRYVDTVPGKGIVELKRPVAWLRYIAKFDLLKQNSVGESQLTHELKFYGGFSYEQIVAINSSIKDLTTGENDIGEEKKENQLATINEIETECSDIVKSTTNVIEKLDAESKVIRKSIGFIPERIVQDRQYPSIYYLNGYVEDGRQAGLSSNDIERFGDETVYNYGSTLNILSALSKKMSFEVAIVKEDERRCKVSLFDMHIKLEEFLDEAIKIDFSDVNSLQRQEVASFNPDDGSLKTDGVNYYLNGFLPNNRRGGLCSTDIQRFGESIKQYGTNEDVLLRLKKLSSFNVVVKDDTNPFRCTVSLFDAGLSLEELLEENEQLPEIETAEESAVESEKEIIILPDIIDNNIILYNCDFSKANSISGEFQYKGTIYKGIIIHVTPKMMKKLKTQQRIQARVISKDEKQYILRI